MNYPKSTYFGGYLFWLLVKIRNFIKFGGDLIWKMIDFIKFGG